MTAQPVWPHQFGMKAEAAGPQRIAIVTDAWLPQVNGVVRTLQSTCEILRAQGRSVLIISPDQFRSIPCPTYPEIRLALATRRKVRDMLDAFRPDAVHLSTEGPLGIAARRICLERRWPFTTAYHTQFPQYLSGRSGLPESLFWRYIHWFHAPADRVFAATQSIREELAEHGIRQVHHWSRGVDLHQFRPGAPPPPEFAELERPIQLYVGRIAVEKNLEAFLGSRYPGSKVVVGDGPARAGLAQRFPQALFLGNRHGAELAGCYAGADVFVFPSRSDTFGLVLIEALACGTPVAAFPVAGPQDIVTLEAGALSENLERATDAALLCDRAACRNAGAAYSWEAATAQFLAGLVPLTEPGFSA